MTTNRKIHVYADWIDLKGATLMGILSAVVTRGKEVFSFEYTEEWIKSGQPQDIDPNLQFFTGPQYNKEDKPNFGLFLDSSPDRWGRVLMKRREAILARIEERKPKTLLESDFLLGVYDEHRMGGLRFKTDLDGDFLSAEKELAAPPFASLRDLEYASLQLEEEKEVKDDEALKWLNMLMAPGASLGGARPKASVKDPKGHLWIAKFPSGNDDRNIGAWEHVAMQIAQDAAIQVVDCEARVFSNKYHTFLSKRFDRTDKGERIHFASAMTLLGYNDGADFHAGVSYLELAEYLMQHGARVDQDLKELWTRIVLNICIKNTDDHLRNHGFLLTDSGWILSPIYDVNPFAEGVGLTLNISEDDNSLSLDLAMSVIEYFRLKEDEAKAIIARVQASVSNWKKIAEALKIPRAEQSRMEAAFVL
jgi:serine/threonine-protein kinase HipA